MSKDYYAILGVQKGSSDADIKQAYRKLSRELHPDKHKGDKSKEAKFKEVNEAYEVLSDPKKKAAYDQFGSADAQGFGGFQGGFGGFDPSQFQGMGDMGDLFDSFFGGGGKRRREADQSGRTIEVEMSIPFSESVTGSEHVVSIKANVVCADCGGSGSSEGAKMVTCAQCGGTGAIQKTARTIFGVMNQSTVCDACHGSGKVPEKPCKKCRGEGRFQDKKTVTIRIPAGIDDGQSLRLKGEGDAGRSGSKSGDLLVHIRVVPDARFTREGDDIRSTLSIKVIDAILGSDVDIDTVHGKSTISIPAGTQPGQVLRLKGKGMPLINSSRHGDHYVTIDVVIPTKLTKDEKHFYDAIKKSHQ